MAKQNGFVDTPMDMIAQPPKGNRGGPGVYDGENQGPFSGYKRTSSPNAVPEKLYDGSVPSVEKATIMPDKLPKNKD
jgi:hypothetical protein